MRDFLQGQLLQAIGRLWRRAWQCRPESPLPGRIAHMADSPSLRLERLGLFSSAMVIRSLCVKGAFERVLQIRDSVVADTDIRRDDLAIGYELTVQAALHDILDRIVRFPELLGASGDDHLLRWWRMVQGDDGTTINASIGDVNSELARMACGIDELINAFRQAGVSWDRISHASKRAENLADELLEVAHESSIYPPSGTAADLDLHTALRREAIFRLDESWRQFEASPAFRYSRRLRTEWQHMHRPGESLFDIQSDRDPMRRHPKHDPKDFDSRWLVGKLAALTISLQEMDLWNDRLPEPERLLRNSADPSRAWDKGNRILAAAEELGVPACELGLEAPPRMPSPILPSLRGPVKPAAAVDRLAALFGRSPATDRFA